MDDGVAKISVKRTIMQSWITMTIRKANLNLNTALPSKGKYYIQRKHIFHFISLSMFPNLKVRLRLWANFENKGGLRAHMVSSVKKTIHHVLAICPRASINFQFDLMAYISLLLASP